MKKLASVFLILTLLVSPLFAHAPKPVLKTAHYLAVQTAEGGYVCSGTSVAEHAFLTVKHCDIPGASFQIDGSDVKVTSRIEDGNDHVILMVDKSFKDVAGFAGKMPKEGDDIWVNGNPAGYPLMVRRGVFSGGILDAGPKGDAQIVWMFDYNGWHGDSGAAVFNSDGKIVAVISIGETEGIFKMGGAFELLFTKDQYKAAGIKQYQPFVDNPINRPLDGEYEHVLKNSTK